MSTHTPGPWWVMPWPEDGTDFSILVSADHYGVAQVYCPHKPDSMKGVSKREGKANARLIAAAPDLLEAAARVIVAEDYKANGGTSVTEQRLAWDQAVHMIRAAIAKAEGR